MIVVTHKQLRTMIAKSYNTHVPIFIWGATGIGKSDTVRAAAREIAKAEKLEYYEGVGYDPKKFSVVDARLSQYDPSDLRGLPFVESNKTTTWAFPSWLPKDGKGIILLDEINLAPPLVQSSAYQLILDRKLGDYVVPAGWSIIAAGNRQDVDKGYTFNLAGPLCNRFIHAELGMPSIQDWSAWALDEGGVDPRIVTFLNFKASFLYKFDPKLKDKSFPTPRAWAKYASPLISDIEDPDTAYEYLAAAVGEGVATECRAYLKLTKKIDIEDIIAHPEKAKEITAIDMKYSLLSALCEVSKKDPKKTLPKVCLVAEHMEAEFAVLLLRFLKNGVKEFLDLVNTNADMRRVLKKFLKYFATE